MSYVGNPANIPVGTLTSTAGTLLNWVKVTKTYLDFSDAGTFKELTIYTLPAGGIVLAVKTKASIVFAGAGATYIGLTIGKTGVDQGVYDPGVSMMAVVANDELAYTSVQQAENHGATTAIIATLSSNIALNTLASGSVTIWLLLATAT
jgi:hypothetical protein